MIRITAGLICVGISLSLLTQGVAQEGKTSWKAGVAKAVITPEKSVWLAGYGSKRAPDGKLHDIWMKSLALEAPTIDQTNWRESIHQILDDFACIPLRIHFRVR